MHAQPTAVVPFDADRPWAAAHRAVFDQHARGIRVDVEIDPLSTVRAADANGVLHADILACVGPNITVQLRKRWWCDVVWCDSATIRDDRWSTDGSSSGWA
jgi:hypothetical protein